ncbi:MAG: four helix bundle protein [Bacteroidetes bacterium]|jgi:four helix bundle protein|nr:four helix bundle protein [Bacteroidota bacterium]MBT5528089.1 four helix bundle protein [Cytophagia bacterium]MBT4337091.1 four helix bundle protein [Bacteroidota bacterium]MBT4729515.1 four helix bundle protein [Bacteroidota bacterium]MBT5991741.1 four helix bundle protein [Bacteroidota bacterium]
MKEYKNDLEERLIDFAVEIIYYIEVIPNTKAGNHLGGQLLRSGTSPALNYSEARSAESKNNFIHKMKVCLKELRETYNCLRILFKANLFKNEVQIKSLIQEANELISIFVKSIETASKGSKN